MTQIWLAPKPIMLSTRFRISSAALFVKVMARICDGITSRTFTRYEILWTRTLVLPDPAPARIRTGPSVCRTASFCSLFKPAVISFTFIFGSALGYACPFIWGALTPSLGRVMAIRVTFVILAAFALICLLVPTFTINEKDFVEAKPVEGNAFSSLTKTFSNRNFRIFVGSDICYWIAITMFQSGLTFFITSLMKLPETMNTVLYIGMTFLSVCLYAFVGKLTRRFAKKSLIIFAFLEFSVVYLITALSQGQTGTNKGMIFGIAVMVLASPAMAILGILPQTVVADIAKSDEVQTGENHDGMFFAARTFAMKLGQSLAAILFTSLATIGRANGTGYRIAAIASTILCLCAAALMKLYNEKKVMHLLGED